LPLIAQNFTYLFFASNLLPLLVCPCPLLQNCVLLSRRSAHGIFTMSSAGIRPSPPPLPIVLFCIYLFIIHILHFLSSLFSHFAHVYVLLCLAITPVRISSLTERLSSELLWLPHTSSLPTTCINPIGWHHATENLSPPPPFFV